MLGVGFACSGLLRCWSLVHDISMALGVYEGTWPMLTSILCNCYRFLQFGEITPIRLKQVLYYDINIMAQCNASYYGTGIGQTYKLLRLRLNGSYCENMYEYFACNMLI